MTGDKSLLKRHLQHGAGRSLAIPQIVTKAVHIGKFTRCPYSQGLEQNLNRAYTWVMLRLREQREHCSCVYAFW